MRACGRRVEPVADGWRLSGLKTPAHGVRLDADLEVYFVPSGYVGLFRPPGGEVNICGLFRSAATVPDLARSWPEWLGGPVGSVPRSRMAGARPGEGSFCSVAGIGPRPERASRRGGCCVGDALTMIPPVTGNGMWMAFGSSELAIGPLARSSRGDLAWAEAGHEIASACDARFTPRLFWATWLQRASSKPAACSALLLLASRSERLLREIFERTR